MNVKEYFDIRELIEYMDANPHPYLRTPCVETVRRWCRAKKIPFIQGGGKKPKRPYIFKKSEIDKWQKNDRII